MAYLYKNNAVATFANPVGMSDTTVTLTTGQGARFPTITGTDTFYVTFSDAASKSILEIALCTAITGDTLTVTRGQDGTTPNAYLAGDDCSLRLNAAVIMDYASKTFGAAFSAPISATVVTSTGLLYGNNGATGDARARGIGNVFLQQGGTPSGGSNGDITLIY
jgi:hypothetical protein